MKFQFLTISAIVCFFGTAWAGGVPIQKFIEVNPDLYRGARPEVTGLQALKSLGIKTDLDLEDDGQVVASEKEAATELGIDFESEPMSGFFAPSDATVDAVFSVLRDPSTFPVYIHCEHGEDRTGLIIGLYRVFDQGWTPKAAYQEMLADGFHPVLLGLNEYFDKQTGYSGF